MSEMTKHYAFFPVHALLALLLAAVVASCLWEPSYPGELSQADSLMIQGHYRQADSLLAHYDSTSTSWQNRWRPRHRKNS